MRDILGGLKVLLVDDHPVRRGILKKYFLRWDCEIEERESTAEAEKAIVHQADGGHPFRIIVIEQEMSTMKGYDFALSLQKNPAATGPVLLLAASREQSCSQSELKKAGIASLLVRPYKLSRLRYRLTNALSGLNKGRQAAPSEDEPILMELQKRTLRILLAEDNLINQKVAQVTLEKMGHKVDLAEDGAAAVKCFSENTYDLILMDIYMPGTDGFEATRRIRTMESEVPGSKAVHICALTAKSSPEDHERCFKVGMNSYIAKPFRLDELVSLLNSL
jgi:two-component system sensor histidine kinase/response regulator